MEPLSIYYVSQKPPSVPSFLSLIYLSPTLSKALSFFFGHTRILVPGPRIESCIGSVES